MFVASRRAAIAVRALSTNRKVIITAYGKPEECVSIVDDQAPPVDGTNVRVNFLVSAVNPADINVIEGAYALLPKTLPAVPGNEGVARVTEVGPNVKKLRVGDHVIPAKALFGTWRTTAVAPESEFVSIPRDIPIDHACTLSVNPCTALRMLDDFVTLKPGDVVVQNGANSAVGVAAIQIARERQLRTINVVRDRPDIADLRKTLERLGATAVITDKEFHTESTKKLLAGFPKPKLAFNCVGGDSATNVARMLGRGGVMVTYGGMSKKPVTVPTSLLIFKDIQLRGFWLTRWVDEHSVAEREVMFETLFDLIRKNNFEVLVQHFPMDRLQEALKHATQGFKGRKVLLDIGK